MVFRTFRISGSKARACFAVRGFRACVLLFEADFATVLQRVLLCEALGLCFAVRGFRKRWSKARFREAQKMFLWIRKVT